MFGFNEQAQGLNKHHHHNSRLSLKSNSGSTKSLNKSPSLVINPTIDIDVSNLSRNRVAGVFTQRSKSIVPSKLVDVRLPAIRIASGLQ